MEVITIFDSTAILVIHEFIILKGPSGQFIVS